MRRSGWSPRSGHETRSIAEPVTTDDLKNVYAAEVAELLFAELIIDINPSELQEKVGEANRSRSRTRKTSRYMQKN
jgi:hypothetical protein